MSVIETTGKLYRVTCEKTGETKVFTYLPKRCFVRKCSSYKCITGDRRKGTFQRIRIEPECEHCNDTRLISGQQCGWCNKTLNYRSQNARTGSHKPGA